MSENIEKAPNVPPFVTFVTSAVPMVFDNSLSYYEALCALWKWLQDDVVNVINNNATVTEEYINLTNELKTFVEDYFDNLDVQEEINNKLDAMVEDGTLQEIITQYIQANTAWCFDTVADMKLATNFIDGSYARTFGFHSLNDGGAALYKVRTVLNDDVVDESRIIALSDNTLVAELVTEGNYINMKQLGMSASNADNATILQNAVNHYSAGNVLFIPADGDYAFSTSINLGNKAITIQGTSSPEYDAASNTALVFADSDGFTNARNVTFKDICIKGNVTTPGHRGIVGGACLDNCVICYFGSGINCSYQGPSVITNCNFHHNTGNAIINPVDSRITNCTINDNGDIGINLQSGANDNIVTDNKIEWNGGYGLSAYNANHLTISNNIFDRNGKSGLYIAGNQTLCSVFSDNVLRRNGALSSGTDSSNILINGAYTSNIITNNVTQIGNSEDDGSGTTVPTYAVCVKDTNANKIYLIDNVLTGGTNADPIGKSSATNVVVIDQDHPIYDNLRIKREEGTAAANGSATFTIPFDELPAAYSQGLYRKVIICARTSTDGTYAFKSLYVHFYKQYGNYVVAVDDGTIGTYLTASASYSDDAVKLTIANSSGAQFLIRADTFSF